MHFSNYPRGMGDRLNFPFKVRNLTDEEQEILNDLYSGQRTNKVKLIGNRSCMPSNFRELKDVFYNFKPRPDDVWLVGFPRSGTTLLQEILYLLENDLNYEKAAKEIMDYKFPVLHTGLLYRNTMSDIFEKCTFGNKFTKPIHETLEETKERRFIKSHQGFSFLHPDLLKIGCKVVFIARNPKDVLNSVSFMPDNATNPKFTFKKLWNVFKHDLTFGGNYFDMLEEAWERRREENLLFLLYEAVNADKEGAVLKIADFLGKKLTDKDLEILLKHLDIDNFRNNQSLNNAHLINIGINQNNEQFSFIRRGMNGGWREGIPPELIGEIDEWARENLAKIPNFEIPECWKVAMG